MAESWFQGTTSHLNGAWKRARCDRNVPKLGSMGKKIISGVMSC
jgi:hypothetical protein